MKVLIFTVLLLLEMAVLRVNSFAQNEPSLELQTRITKTKYCDSSSMSISLELTYRNTGTRNVILNKYLPSIYSYRVSKDIKKFESKIYEQEGLMHFDYGIGNPKNPKLSDGSDFTYSIIEPGREHTLEMPRVISLSIVDKTSDCDPDDRCLKTGRHILQISSRTWGLSDDLANERRDKWKMHGDLFTKSLLSVPLEFQIEPINTRKITSCN